MINEATKAEFDIPSRRKKMNFRDFETIGIRFTDFHKNKYGYVYRLEKVLTTKQKEFILHFNNTRIAITQTEYAPELKKSLVLIANKCLR